MTPPPSPLLRAAPTAAPVLLALGFTAISLHASDVGAGDIVVFASYVALGLVLPGVLTWRLLVSHGRGSLLADLACGTSLAYAIELGTYLLCAHVGHPDVAWLWPVVPVALSAHPRWRRTAWRRGEPGPRWMPWLLSGLVCWAVAVLTRTNWDLYPLHGKLARAPYIDTPYHLSLVGALGRHVPVDLPSVAGQPLYYHWFVHADLAAAHHATGIEDLVLLTRLGPLMMMVVGILGVAALAQRLAGSALSGGLAALLYTAGGSAVVAMDFGPMAVGPIVILSPTTVFATALLVATAAVTFELLSDHPGPSRQRIPAWLVLALMLGAVSGAKGSLLPVLIGGYAAVVAMALLLDRRLHRPALGMLALAVGWFLLAQRVVYGGSAQGTAVKPFGLGDLVAAQLGMGTRHQSPFLLAAGITLVYLGSKAIQLVGAVGLFTRDTWRDQRAHFAVGVCVAAVGAAVAFDSDAFNQVYFLLVAPPLIAIASAWGLTVLARRIPAGRRAGVLVPAVLVGLVVAWVVKPVFVDRPHPDGRTVGGFFLPVALTLLACGLAAAVIGSREPRGHRRIAVTLAATSALAAIGVAPNLSRVEQYLTSPGDQFRTVSVYRYRSIGLDGVVAARWLRDHSGASDVVATNAHCIKPDPLTVCDRRKTWMAGFTERQMLLEGWAYSSRSAADAEKQGVTVRTVAFWDPALLRANDLAFKRPTRERLDVLRDEYQVRWLFADLRFPVDLPRLRRLADLEYRSGDYAVLRLR